MKTIKLRNSFKFIAIIMILFSLGILGCEKSSTDRTEIEKKKESEPFRFALLTWVNHGPFYLAKEKGFYEKYDLKVEIQKIEDIGMQKLALQSGNLDGTISSVDFFATAAAEGVQAVTVMKLGAGDGSDAIVANETINTVKDLKGHTIAVEKGGPDHFFLLFVLEKHGLTSKDVNLVFMTTADAGAAYVAGRVDACVVWEPWVSNAASKRKSNILATSKDFSDVLVDIFIVRNDVIKQRREDVKNFMRAWFDAIEYWKKNPKESNQIMADGLGISVEDFEAMLGGVKLSDYKDNLAYFGTKETPGLYWSVFETANQIYKREKIIDNPANPRTVTDITLLGELQ